MADVVSSKLQETAAFLTPMILEFVGARFWGWFATQ
jgi:hypothetical protein